VDGSVAEEGGEGKGGRPGWTGERWGKKARADLGTSGSEGREAAAALEAKSLEATIERADRLMVPGSKGNRWTWARVETPVQDLGSHHQARPPAARPPQHNGQVLSRRPPRQAARPLATNTTARLA